ncbi:MAG: ABC transporter substrate-binding protein [Lachnospiraceae bacterium]|nr:ABC transporter substrate-binding protein [Lachnospiraceae bacterium]
MKRFGKVLPCLLSAALCLGLPSLTGCGGTITANNAGNGSNAPLTEEALAASLQKNGIADGTYACEVTLEGGTGRASIGSPVTLIAENGQMTARIVWSSANYDYMMVGDERYEAVIEDGHSVFEIPVADLDTPLAVKADTTAMSTAHEIDYTLIFDKTSLKDSDGFAVTVFDEEEQEAVGAGTVVIGEAPAIPGLTFEESVTNTAAVCFQIDRYADGYSLIRTDEGGAYLLVPENGTVDEAWKANYTILQKDLDKVYVAATASMSLINAAGSVDRVRMSGTGADKWYVDSAREAMERGDILFAGKYSEPDYEMLLAEGCDLAVESSMISHSPDVKEKLESLGIPVFVDRSSYEPDPVGRMEWMMVYGEIFGRTDKAKESFEAQKALVESLKGIPNTEKTVAFFYISTNGTVVARKPNDYLARMIEMAGGRYAFKDLGGDAGTATSTVTMNMETFYAAAVDADYLIYNATVSDPVSSVDELLRKNPTLADFKAVKNGQVWCTDRYLYQASDAIGTMIADMHTMLTDESCESLTFLTKLH